MEGIAPIWVDLNEDGERAIIVTRSNADSGAQIVVLDELGNLIATGPAIGRGGRWRHQLSAGPFGPNGELELVDVLTPHIGGPTEFYQWKNNELVVVTSASGYTSHVIGSRNLDMTAAGQFDESERLTNFAAKSSSNGSRRHSAWNGWGSDGMDLTLNRTIGHQYSCRSTGWRPSGCGRRPGQQYFTYLAARVGCAYRVCSAVNLCNVTSGGQKNLAGTPHEPVPAEVYPCKFS